MISIITAGLLSIWSVTSISGSVTYYCTTRRQIEGRRRLITIRSDGSYIIHNLKDISPRSSNYSSRRSSRQSNGLLPNLNKSSTTTAISFTPINDAVITKPQNRITHHDNCESSNESSDSNNDETHDITYDTVNDLSNDTTNDKISNTKINITNNTTQCMNNKTKGISNYDDTNDDDIHDGHIIDQVLYKLESNDQNSHHIINIFDTATNDLSFRFIKPQIRLNSDKIWNHDYYFERVDNLNSRIASIFNAKVGNGGFVEILQNDKTLNKLLLSDQSKNDESIYKTISLQFDFMNFKSNNDEYDQTNDGIQMNSNVCSFDDADHNGLRVGEKIHLSSKITKNLFEFKLLKDESVFTYKWFPGSGYLKKINKLGDSINVAYIIKGENKNNYLIEINKDEINPVIALCTSIVIMNKS